MLFRSGDNADGSLDVVADAEMMSGCSSTALTSDNNAVKMEMDTSYVPSRTSR